MNTVFARAIVAFSLVALPASALASTKTSTKHHSFAKKDVVLKKKGKHHAHKATGTRAVAATPSKPSVAAKAAPAASDEKLH